MRDVDDKNQGGRLLRAARGVLASRQVVDAATAHLRHWDALVEALLIRLARRLREAAHAAPPRAAAVLPAHEGVHVRPAAAAAHDGARGVAEVHARHAVGVGSERLHAEPQGQAGPRSVVRNRRGPPERRAHEVSLGVAPLGVLEHAAAVRVCAQRLTTRARGLWIGSARAQRRAVRALTCGLRQPRAVRRAADAVPGGQPLQPLAIRLRLLQLLLPLLPVSQRRTQLPRLLLLPPLVHLRDARWRRRCGRTWQRRRHRALLQSWRRGCHRSLHAPGQLEGIAERRRRRRHGTLHTPPPRAESQGGGGCSPAKA
mmetsp:Transcript_54697/g.140839  ORF Transcript_54697/g.140839 Transcript_54697/m.140839 type:complete len:314 (-) Transcript_54697:3-944(-)